MTSFGSGAHIAQLAGVNDRHHARDGEQPGRDHERGAVMVLTLVAITALLSLAALTLLQGGAELRLSGQSRFQQEALYAAESGNHAGIEFLRSNCNVGTFFSDFVSPANTAPARPEEIVGNDLRPGEIGNPFASGSDIWYSVELLNNRADPGFLTGADTDAIVVLRATGHGPDQTVSIVELEVQNSDCVEDFCEIEYAQRNVSARNDANALCSKRFTGNLKSVNMP